MTSAGDTPTIRPARPEDVPAVVAMVHELAEYERSADECTLTTDQLRSALFGPAPALFGHVAVDSTDRPLGFALWFRNFSTWTGGHGIYLEDLYVRPTARGTGAGRMLMAALAALCVERGYQRFEWAMLDWNPAAGFYAAIGATPMRDWLPYRLTGSSLVALAQRAGQPGATGTGTAAGTTTAGTTTAADTTAAD